MINKVENVTIYLLQNLMADITINKITHNTLIHHCKTNALKSFGTIFF